jgi:RNA polymerase sigma factor (sigma-70 family)
LVWIRVFEEEFTTVGTYARSFEFDDEYLRRLRERDPEIAEHFGIYFGRVLNRNLRCRCRKPELIDDIRQETLRRVLEIIRKAGLNNPKRLEAFVTSVCSNVLFEYWRTAKKHAAEEPKSEPVGLEPDPEQAFTRTEAVLQLRQGLRTLPVRDREVLKMAFFEERDSLELSIRLSVSRTYARVLVHRAIAKLRESLLASQTGRACYHH